MWEQRFHLQEKITLSPPTVRASSCFLPWDESAECISTAMLVRKTTLRQSDVKRNDNLSGDRRLQSCPSESLYYDLRRIAHVTGILKNSGGPPGGRATTVLFRYMRGRMPLITGKDGRIILFPIRPRFDLDDTERIEWQRADELTREISCLGPRHTANHGHPRPFIPAMATILTVAL
jgi:hypothetical protein